MTLSVQDRIEVLDLAARYCDAIDAGRYDEWVELFTPGGVLEWSGGKAAGRSALKQFTEHYRSDPNRGGARNLRHWSANQILEVTGEEVRIALVLLCHRERRFVVRSEDYRDWRL